MTLENLLNSLIEEGWKPFGIEKEDIEVVSYDKNRKKISIGYINWSSPSKGEYDWLFLSLRDITTKESGLWQFCVENGMLARKWQGTNWLGGEPEKCFDYRDYEYRIIESALKDESELENFLLKNIKTKG